MYDIDVYTICMSLCAHQVMCVSTAAYALHFNFMDISVQPTAGQRDQCGEASAFVSPFYRS
jgi:hypothetical protein